MPAAPIPQAVNKTYQNIRHFEIPKDGGYSPIRYGSNSNSYEPKVLEVIERPIISDSKISPSIRMAIEESKYILDLKPNWDDSGALAINPISYKMAIDFLSRYSESILDVCECDCELIAPSISPVKNGSVDLEWNLEKSYLLINFTESNEDFVYYYLAFKEGDNIVFDANGQVSTKKVSNKFAADLVSLS